MTRTPRPETALPNRRKQNHGGSDGQQFVIVAVRASWESWRPVAVKAGGGPAAQACFKTVSQNGSPADPWPVVGHGTDRWGRPVALGLESVGWRPGIARVPDTCNVIALDFSGPCLNRGAWRGR